jgi:hypothetical protein
MARKWLPHIYVDESSPPGRDTPSDWIAPDTAGLPRLAPADDDHTDADDPPVPLSDGDIVPFAWIETYGHAKFELHEDGTFTCDMAMPPDPAGGHALVWISGDPDTMAGSLHELAINLTDDGEIAEHFIVQFYGYSDRPVPHEFRDGAFHAIEEH